MAVMRRAVGGKNRGADVGIMLVILAGVLILLVIHLMEVGQRTLRQIDEAVAGFVASTVGDPVVDAPLLRDVVDVGFVPVASFPEAGDPPILRSLALASDSVILEVAWCEGPAAPPARAAFFSVLADGHAALMTQSIACMPAARGELRQVFPDVSVDEMLRHHRESLAWLASQGITHHPVPTADAAVQAYRSWLVREGEAVKGARWTVGLAIWWRIRRRSYLDVGPIADQPDIQASLTEIRDRPETGGQAER